jgi:hypothetical protein
MKNPPPKNAEFQFLSVFLIPYAYAMLLFYLCEVEV